MAALIASFSSLNRNLWHIGVCYAQCESDRQKHNTRAQRSNS